MRAGRKRHVRDLVARTARFPLNEQLRLIERLPPAAVRTMLHDWPSWAHDGQLPPGDPDWRVWLIQAGRGFGKTRAGAEWVHAAARTLGHGGRIALVGATTADVARVMVEGASGLIATARPDEKHRWIRERGVFSFASGAHAYAYSAAAPESLRGPEHHLAWCDELGKWESEAAWDNLILGLRLESERFGVPRVLVTTTPRTTPLMRRVRRMPRLALTGGATGANPHLPESFVEAVEGVYAGTRLGRQELAGEMIDDVEGALWPRALIEARRLAMPSARDSWARVVVGIDPPAGTLTGTGGDACGIVAAALTRDGHVHVLEDASVICISPESWAQAAAAAAARVGADRVVAEVNQGGRMVESVFKAAGVPLPVTMVRATQGKVARAEPVAALYEAGRAWHAGVFAALEEQMAGLQIGGGYQGPGRSPDRADALVWAVTELMKTPAERVIRVRVIE